MSNEGTSNVDIQQLLEKLDQQQQLIERLQIQQNNQQLAFESKNEFTQYVKQQKLKNLDMPKYQINNSLRVYFFEFEQQAKYLGITDMDLCTVTLCKFLPDNMRNWIIHLPNAIKSKWTTLTQNLLQYFGKSLNLEQRQGINKLQALKQKRNESIAQHTTNWINTYHIIPQGSNIISVIDLRDWYVQSLYDTGLVATLTTSILLQGERGTPASLEYITKQAMKIGSNLAVSNYGKSSSYDEQGPDYTKDDPMDIDHMNQKKKFDNKKQFYKKNKFKKGKNKFQNNKINTNNNEPPKLYDKYGNPVCGYCNGKHRNYECTQNNRSLHQLDTTESSSEDVIELQHIDAGYINHIKNGNLVTPTTIIKMGSNQILALWDTGAAITAINYEIINKLNLNMDTSQTIQYIDINNNNKTTLGVVYIQLFNTKVKFHVIKDLAKQMIIGFDTMTKWNTIIETNKNRIKLTINGKQYYIQYSKVQRQQIMCTDSQQKQLNSILKNFQTIFLSGDQKPSITNKMECHIDTGDHEPIYSPPRYYHPKIQKQIDEKFKELIKNGIVTKVAFSEWGSPVTAVAKQDKSIRICGNYIKLNAITKTIKYPYVNLHYALQSLGKAKIFSKLDLISGYYQIPIAECDKSKSALVTQTSIYVFNSMGMGMKNSSAYFQSLMDKVLGEMRYVSAIAYQDDVILYSDNFDQHLQHLKTLLDKFKEANLSINIKKCQFAMKQVKFLGFIVSDQGIQADPDKVRPITQLPPPKDIKELERFLGMTGVYQKFIKQYQVIIEPLRRLKMKDQPFIWKEEQQEAFKKIKQQLSNLPNLIQPDFDKQFELHTDAANSAGIAVILCQRYEGHPYPLAFASRSLSKHEKNYAIRELEALAIIFGIKKFRIYLECNQFIIYTDHSSLQWILNTNEDKQPRLFRWCLFLQAYDFVVKYVPGKKNHAADALSRSTIFNIELKTRLQSINWQSEQEKDDKLQEYKTHDNKAFTISNGIIFKIMQRQQNIFSNRICKVVPSQLTQTVIKEFHDKQFAGHCGINKTIKAISKQFWWENMKQEVGDYIKKCNICQKVKGDRSHQYNTSNTAGEKPFQKIAIDYFGPLPMSEKGNVHILVIIDTFTKYVEIYPMKSILTSELAKVLYYNYILRHGIPDEIISDNGAPFNSEFLQQLNQYLNIKISFTPPNHPSSNGIVERYMKTLRQMILVYAQKGSIVKQWDTNLRLIRFVYNNMIHQSTGFSPFELVYGRMSKSINQITQENKDIPLYKGQSHTPQSKFASQLKENLEQAFEIVYNNLTSNEHYEYNNELKVNDKVLLFNTSRSSKVRPRKLQQDWIGPMIIFKVLSKTRYNLKHYNKRYKNIHISLIKKYYD